MKLASLGNSVATADLRTAQPLEHGAWEKAAQQRKLTGRPWRRLRESVLLRDCYLCQCHACQSQGLLTEAHEVDHIIPIAQGGTDSPSNLRAINRECHKLKTQRESAAGQNARRGW